MSALSMIFSLLESDNIANWINEKGMSLCDYMIKIVIAIFLYIISSKIMKKIVSVVQARLDKRNVDQIASHFILNIIKYGILTFIIISIITQLKIVEVTSIAALVASAGVGISLAMQGALSNFAGGVLLLILRPFRKGDYILIPTTEVEGVVEEIEIYYTTVRTILGETVKIPNSQLTNNSVVNRKGSDYKALVVNINISYKSDIDLVKKTILEIVSNQQNVAKDNISVFVDELCENGIKLGAFVMVPVSEYLRIKRNINEEIIHAFRKEGIEIPYNQLDVHVINSNKQ
ncbi:MAG: mechanosensitive ion channel [Eubacterium sp.]|nr:mechanosensitive ion channel [Eubacterium sp.]